MMKTRVLITGGAGFIGSHLADALRREHEVILFDNFRRNSLGAAPGLFEAPDLTVVNGDVLDRNAVRQAMAGVDVVLHLAAIAGVSSYYREPLRTLQVNMLGTANVLETAVECGVGTFVYFSTSEVFGPDALWVDEEAGFRIGPVSDRRWVYATSKLAGEHLALRYGEQYGMRVSVVRPFNVYGPRQTGEGAISNFCGAVARGEPITIYGDGGAIRAWCYVSDMVSAVLAILSRPGTAGESFNIGNPAEVETTLGLARRILRLAPETQLVHRPCDRAEVRARIPAIQKARQILGFEPRVDLDEGLKHTLEWFGCVVRT
jgi:nucleoside-diphosphate-sugar epimerase